LSRAQAVLSSAREEAASAGDRRHELRADLTLRKVELSADPSADADKQLEAALAAISVLEESGDERALGRTWLDIAELQSGYRNCFAEAEEAARRALLHYRLAGWPFSACLGTIADAFAYGPTPVKDALAGCRELLAEADLNGRSTILPPVAVLTAMTGAFDSARELLRSSRETRINLGQSLVAEYVFPWVEANIELMAGDLAKARKVIESTCRVLERLGERDYLATRRALLADLLYRSGSYDAAAKSSRAAQSGSTKDDISTEWLWRSVEARLAARDGDSARADLLIQAALRMIERTDHVVARGTCWLDKAEVLSLTGRPDEAAAAIRKALRLFEKKGDLVHVDQARALLAETTKSP
jgi:tetratricopeptide (TPR) repeat protein